MNIAFLHYHTRKGGVTTVIGQQIKALKENCNCIIIKGEEGAADFDVPNYVIGDLAYDRLVENSRDAEEVADAIVTILNKAFPDGCDILHVHNPLLKKNSSLLRVLKQVQTRVSLFLQVHDFAEEGRPGVYFRHESYPADCHYSVINSRDYGLLKNAGLKPEGLHLLPNMVTPLPEPETGVNQDLVLYPVRAIRRKNIGEVLLHSVFLPEDLKLAVTLPPNSERDFEPYELWRQTAEEFDLSVLFAIGGDTPFEEVLARTKFVITTSIKEGFGFSFLEPWTIDLEVRGRWLDAVCGDFVRTGVRLNNFYSAFLVPLTAFDYKAFRHRWRKAAREWGASFDVNFSRPELDRELQRLLLSGSIDFALLDETAQREVIVAAVANQTVKDSILQANEWLEDLFTNPADQSSIVANKTLIGDQYSESTYRKKLLEMYKQAQKPVHHRVDKNLLLSEFLSLTNFSMLGS